MPENEVESKTVNDDQKAEPQSDASGVVKAEVTDEYAASQATAESPDGDAFAVSHAGMDSEGRVQAHGHVEVSCLCSAVTTVCARARVLTLVASASKNVHFGSSY